MSIEQIVRPLTDYAEITTQDGTVVDVVEQEFADHILSHLQQDLEDDNLQVHQLTSRGLQWLADEESRLETQEPTDADYDACLQSYYGFGSGRIAIR